MKKILVTGGAGFIGSNLCRLLLEKGNEVCCFDNLQTGYMANVKELMGNKHFLFVLGDVTMQLPRLHFNEIYNLACPASPPAYQKDAIKTTMTSVLGMKNVLDLACKCGAKVLQASTSEVYGDPTCSPQSEYYWGNVNPNGLRSCYDEGKRCAESLCFSYARQKAVDVKVIRIFNTYGPSMAVDDGRVISNFIVQALTGKPMTIYGDGSQTRSPQYIDDLLSGMTRMMETDKECIGPVNIGNPCEYSVLDIAKKVLELTGSKSPIEYRELPSDDPKRRKPDISRAKELLRWEPVISLEEGLQKTIDYFKDKLMKL